MATPISTTVIWQKGPKLHISDIRKMDDGTVHAFAPESSIEPVAIVEVHGLSSGAMDRDEKLIVAVESRLTNEGHNVDAF